MACPAVPKAVRKVMACQKPVRYVFGTMPAVPHLTNRFELTTQERAALDLVFEFAEGHSSTGLRLRRLLCSWWNAGELGGFHLSDLWQFDHRVKPAALTVIALIARLPIGTYADALEGYGPRMRALATRRSRELELGAKFTYQLWDEARQDWIAFDGPYTCTRFETRAEAERERYSAARAAGRKLDDLQVVPVWDDEERESGE